MISSVDYKDISERIAVLTQEIRDLQEMNVRYSKETEHTRRPCNPPDLALPSKEAEEGLSGRDLATSIPVTRV